MKIFSWGVSAARILSTKGGCSFSSVYTQNTVFDFVKLRLFKHKDWLINNKLFAWGNLSNQNVYPELKFKVNVVWLIFYKGIWLIYVWNMICFLLVLIWEISRGFFFYFLLTSPYSESEISLRLVCLLPLISY